MTGYGSRGSPSALRGLYEHLHCLITDGAFEERGTDVRFLAAEAPSSERMTAVLAHVHDAVGTLAWASGPCSMPCAHHSYSSF